MANAFGWIVGGMISLWVVIINIEAVKHYLWIHHWLFDFRKPSVVEPILFWLPIAFLISVFQLIILRRWKINVSFWVLLSTCIWIFTIILWWSVFGRDNYSYHRFSLGSFAIEALVAGACVGLVQSAILRKQLAKPYYWFLAIFGGFVLSFGIINMLAFLLKPILLNLSYALGLFLIVEVRWLVLYGFLFIVCAIGTSVFTGLVLNNHGVDLASRESVKFHAG